LFNSLHSSRSPSPQTAIRVVCLSDTHTQTFPIPDGDILIHAGDLTNNGTVSDIQAQVDWLSSLPHPHKFGIAGNHDTYLDPRSRATLPNDEQVKTIDWKAVNYLQHSGKSLKFDNGRKISLWGAPQIPKCGGSDFAFQYEVGLDAWTGTLPDKVDILITHTPPKFHRDLSSPWLGCQFLLSSVWKLRPTLHVFGHVHAGAGREIVRWDELQATYEGSMARPGKNGCMRQLFSVSLWLDVIKVTWYGFTAVVWDWVWGGQVESTIMVNASLMVNNSGQLGNPVQVVYI